MKALILAGGKGTRLKPLTSTRAKQLLPVGNKPILFYILDQIKEAGLRDIGIVISPETGSLIREAVRDGSRWEAQITYILQRNSLGIAHGVKTAQEFLGNSSFLLFLGDNLIKGGVHQFAQQFNDSSHDALILLKEVPDPRLFGIAKLDGEGNIIHLEEKPKKPETNLALVGIYFFTPVVHQAIAKIKPSWRGELEITDAIQKLIDMGKKIKSHILEDWWLDTGKRDDILEANRVVLDDLLKRNIKGEIDSRSQIVGRVEIGEGTRVVNSTVRGPVAIAERCLIRDSIICPFSSIGANTRIEGSSVEHSVILENCLVASVERLADSILGAGTEVTEKGQNFRARRLLVGDDAKIEL